MPVAQPDRGNASVPGMLDRRAFFSGRGLFSPSAMNVGSVNAAELATSIVEKGKPHAGEVSILTSRREP